VIGTRGARPRGARDGIGAPEPPQAAAWALATGLALCVGWAALACASGGIDYVDGTVGRGPTGAFVALVVAAPAAALALWAVRDSPALRSGPALVGLGGAAGLAAWSLISIAWASGPDLAWVEGNKALLALAAMIMGLALGTRGPRAPALLAIGLSVAAVAPVGWALISKVFPDLGGGDGDLARLSAPLGAWNALALVAVIAVPGALRVAGRRAPRWAAPLAAAWLCALLVTVLLTYSRGGLLALVVAVALATWGAPRAWASLGALLAAVVATVPAAAYGLGAHALSTDGIAVADRRTPGLVLGALILAGMALAAGLTLAGRALAPRARPASPRTLRRAGLAALAVVVIAIAAGAAVGHSWVGARLDELAGSSSQAAVGNASSRLLDPSSNNRRAWWGEAGRGFTSAPLAGHGAGSFRLVHLQERQAADPRFTTDWPHQIVLQLLSELGVVGLILAALAVAGPIWAAVLVRRRGEAAVMLPLAVLVAFLIQAQVDWTWSVPALGVAAFACAGVILGRVGGPPRTPRRPWGWPAASALALVATLAIASALLPWWSEREVAAGQSALDAGRTAAALDHARLARDLNPLSLAPLDLEAAVAQARGDEAAYLAAVREETRVQPDNPASWRLVAAALPPAEAAVAWRRALALDPRNPVLRRSAGVP
jgi:O-antigen ligase/polysaccharide polymerase Wzy-like membrane protein